MATFNVLTASVRCANCGKVSPFRIQFKYGDTWQHEYQLHQPLHWSGKKSDIGSPAYHLVSVAGTAEAPCEYCGFDENAFTITVIDNIIEEVVAGKEQTDEDYEVLR